MNDALHSDEARDIETDGAKEIRRTFLSACQTETREKNLRRALRRVSIVELRIFRSTIRRFVVDSPRRGQRRNRRVFRRMSPQSSTETFEVKSGGDLSPRDDVTALSLFFETEIARDNGTCVVASRAQLSPRLSPKICRVYSPIRSSSDAASLDPFGIVCVRRFRELHGKRKRRGRARPRDGIFESVSLDEAKKFRASTKKQKKKRKKKHTILLVGEIRNDHRARTLHGASFDSDHGRF